VCLHIMSAIASMDGLHVRLPGLYCSTTTGKYVLYTVVRS